MEYGIKCNLLSKCFQMIARVDRIVKGTEYRCFPHWNISLFYGFMSSTTVLSLNGEIQPPIVDCRHLTRQ